MKKTLLALLMLTVTLMMTISNADARRLGGGGSFGRQSSGFARPAPARQMATPPPARPASAPPPTASAWRGMLGGALVGLGLGALMSHFGMGGGFGSLLGILVLGFVVMTLVRLFLRKAGPPGGAIDSPGYSPKQPVYAPEIGTRLERAGIPAITAPNSFDSAAPGIATDARPWGVPDDFDVPGFIRSAKGYFIRLQAAWDKADINDIRYFTSPEMFAELRLQLQERGASANNTDVVQIDGELLGIETVSDEYLASIRFTGLIKEVPEASAEPFTEIWNLSKPLNGQTGWVLAGIQQVA